MKIIIVILACIVCSCTKQTDYSYLNTDRTGTYEYQMVVDWHSLDTTVLHHRYTQDLGKLKEEDVKTWREMWYIDCNMLDRLQHLYYRKKPIQ